VNDGFQSEQSTECGLGNTFFKSYEIGRTFYTSLIWYFTEHGGILLLIQEYKCIGYTNLYKLFIIGNDTVASPGQRAPHSTSIL
jgi:hypothetical protein